MEIKGLSVKSIVQFVNQRYPGRYNEWVNSLPGPSQKIFLGFIKVNEWYPLIDALTVPIKTVGKVFYNDDWKTAVWEMGRFSADEALKGIYKLYVKMDSARHIIDRGSRVMSAYFNPSEIKLVSSDKKSLILHIIRFDEPDEAIEYNIAGWIQRALEISGCKDVTVEISKSLAKKQAYSEFLINWK